MQVVIVRTAMYVLGLLGAATVLVWVDQSPSHIANQASLLVLMLGAALLGLAAPRRAWLSALILGGCLAATHAIYLAAGVALPYEMAPTGWAGPATLLILLLPAGLAAYLGAGTHVIVRSRQQPPLS